MASQSGLVIVLRTSLTRLGEKLALPNKSFHLTKPLGTHLAFARSAPNDFAGEPNVRQIKGCIMKMYLGFVVLLIAICGGCDSKTPEAEDLLPFELSDLDSLPIGLEVVHTPETVLADSTGASGYKYTWTFKTTVRATGAPVSIQEFGSLMDENGRWVLGNVTKKFFSQNDFAEWYSCPEGFVTSGSEFSDPTNWVGNNCMQPGKVKWFYVGIDDKGRRVKGVAVVEQLAELME